MKTHDPLFPQRLARLLQAKGDLQAELDIPMAGFVISIPAESVLERGGTPGNFRVQTPANPAAGAGLTIVVPEGEVWLPRALRFELVTEVTAGMREIILAFDKGSLTTTFAEVITTFEQAASITQAYTFAEGLPREIDTSISRTQAGLPAVALLDGYRMRIVVNNIKAADQINNVVFQHAVA